MSLNASRSSRYTATSASLETASSSDLERRSSSNARFASPVSKSLPCLVLELGLRGDAIDGRRHHLRQDLQVVHLGRGHVARLVARVPGRVVDLLRRRGHRPPDVEPAERRRRQVECGTRSAPAVGDELVDPIGRRGEKAEIAQRPLEQRSTLALGDVAEVEDQSSDHGVVDEVRDEHAMPTPAFVRAQPSIDAHGGRWTLGHNAPKPLDLVDIVRMHRASHEPAQIGRRGPLEQGAPGVVAERDVETTRAHGDRVSGLVDDEPEPHGVGRELFRARGREVGARERPLVGVGVEGNDRHGVSRPCGATSSEFG